MADHSWPAPCALHVLPCRAMSGPPRLRSFNRERLPPPAEFYSQQGLALVGRGPWRSALCPFHEDTRPSLRVSVESGAFRCMACGVKGGDVLAFQMQRHGQRFVEAARALGAWEPAR